MSTYRQPTSRQTAAVKKLFDFQGYINNAQNEAEVKALAKDAAKVIRYVPSQIIDVPGGTAQNHDAIRDGHVFTLLKQIKNYKTPESMKEAANYTINMLMTNTIMDENLMKSILNIK